MNSIRRLGVPLGSRLQMITRHRNGGVGTTRLPSSWRIWTGLRSKQAPPDRYQGSYIELFDDGHVESWRGDECLFVMEGDDVPSQGLGHEQGGRADAAVEEGGP